MNLEPITGTLGIKQELKLGRDAGPLQGFVAYLFILNL